MSTAIAKPASKARAVGDEAWTSMRVGDTGQYINGLAFKPADWGNEGMPIIRIQNLTDANKPLNRTVRAVDPAYVVNRGDILVSWSATLDVFIWDREPALLNQHIFRVVPDTAVVTRKFLFYTLKKAIAEMIKSEHLHGSTMKHINRGPFLAHEVAVPSLKLQGEVVAELEKQFSRLDEAVANLKRVKANLKRYKAAVLNDAVEGRLVPTEAELARREGRSFDSGDQLLQRILKSRRHEWRGKRSYREPVAPAGVELSALPKGWGWASPDQLSASEPYSLAIGPFGSSLKVIDYTTIGVPLVFVRNIRAASFGGAETVFVTPAKAEELKAHVVKAGDILVTKMGAPPGDVCVYPATSPPAVITADCIKLRLARDYISTAFIAYAVESYLVQKQIQGITKGVAQLKVSLGNFSSIGLPLPPVQEQRRIVDEVDRRLSLVHRVETEVDANLRRTQLLRQSVLAQSFAGH